MSDIIGIIGAMDIEVEGIIAQITDREEKTISGIRYVKGKMGEKTVVVAKCGIGKVFASMCAQTMILNFNPVAIINSGVAGTLDRELGVLDVAIATSVVQHDMDTSAIGDPKGLISGINKVYFEADSKVYKSLLNACVNTGNKAKYGTIASADKFVAREEDKAEIKNEFSAIACEMEGGAIGHVCYVNNIPFGVIRVISDGEGAVIDYNTFSKIAAEKSVNIVKEFVKLF